LGKRCDSRDLHPVRVGMSQDADMNKLSGIRRAPYSRR